MTGDHLSDLFIPQSHALHQIIHFGDTTRKRIKPEKISGKIFRDGNIFFLKIRQINNFIRLMDRGAMIAVKHLRSYRLASYFFARPRLLLFSILGRSSDGICGMIEAKPINFDSFNCPTYFHVHLVILRGTLDEQSIT